MGRGTRGPRHGSASWIRVTEMDDPPRHLVLGAFGVEAVTRKLKASLTEIEAWREASLAANFPKV